MERMVEKRALIASLILLLGACAGERMVDAPRTVEVKVPVPVRAEPPDELLAPIEGITVDAFVAPSDKRAVLGLTDEGAAALHDLLERISARVAAWRAWAQAEP
jgi:hypothetical protein